LISATDVKELFSFPVFLIRVFMQVGQLSIDVRGIICGTPMVPEFSESGSLLTPDDADIVLDQLEAMLTEEVA